MDISRVRIDLTGDMTELRDLLNMLDSYDYCDYVFGDTGEGEGNVQN